MESVNRANFASVRGELYPVSMTLDELEDELERYGFFRCHRSYIVNVQKVAKVERFTRNSFNLTLADAAATQIRSPRGAPRPCATATGGGRRIPGAPLVAPIAPLVVSASS